MTDSSDAVVVRMAQARDEDDIMNLCRLLHEENGQFQMSDEKVRAALRQAFERRGGVIGVIDGPNGLEGMILLHIGQIWYSDDWMLEEMFNFVHPNFRKGSSRVRALVEFAKGCSERLSKEAGHSIPLMIGVLSSKRTAAKVRIYESMGLPNSGAYFIYNGQAVH